MLEEDRNLDFSHNHAYAPRVSVTAEFPRVSESSHTR
jgi:hypothetical protein